MKQCEQQKKQKPRNGIREYQRIRRYLSKIYLYGFFKRRHFDDMNGGSAKDYSFIMNLIRELIDTGAKRDSKAVHRVYHRDSSRVLTDSYMYRAMDIQTDMVEYLLILRALYTGAKTFVQIDKQLSLRLAEVPSARTVRNRIAALVSYGCVEKTADGQLMLADDELGILTAGQLVQLYRYVCFCACSTYPRVAGSFLRRTLERCFYTRNLAVPAQDTILLRHNANHNTFDEELVYQLLSIMEQPCWVFFDDRKRLPVEIRAEARLGRWYVLCADEKYCPRIEKITNVEKLEKTAEAVPTEQWEQVAYTVKQAFSNALCSARQSEPVFVEAKLDFGQATGLHRQFLREIRMGQVVRRSNGEYYEAWINDPLELKPLLRSYAPFLQVLPGNHTLREDLRTDLEQMLAALDKEVAV